MSDIGKTNAQKRLRVLMAAYACAPHMGSEQGVGWDCVTALAAHHDLWVVTKTDYQPMIEAELAVNPLPGVTFIYFDLPRFLRVFGFGSYRKPSQLYYYLWQIAAAVPARRVCRSAGIGLAHHLTFVKYWAPSFVSMLPVPYLWGPVGGGEEAPREFWRTFSLRGKLYEILRDFGRFIGERDPLIRMVARRAAMSLATSEETVRRISRIADSSGLDICSAIGVTDVDLDVLENLPGPKLPGVRFLSIGRLLHWKGYHLSLAAFASASIEGAEYWIVGDGPERQRLEESASRLGVSDRVRFLGQVPRKEVFDLLGQSDVFVHPSLHESGGAVCLEAMAARRPVIALALGGPARHVTAGTGILVDGGSVANAIDGLSDAMNRLARDADARKAMGEAGWRRIRDIYSWDRKAGHYADLYRTILG